MDVGSSGVVDGTGAPGTAGPSGAERVVVDSALYVGGRRQAGPLSVAQAAREAQAPRGEDGFVWLGLRHPTADDVVDVAAAFGLPALAVEDAVKAHQRPKLEVYDDVVFVVLKPARYVDHDEVVEVGEIAMFLGPRFVVTVRHGHGEVLGRVRAEMDRGEGPAAGFGPAGVLYRAADLVVDGYEQALEEINSDVDDIEARVFGPGQGNHAERIYKLKQEAAELRRAVLPLGRPLQRLMEADVPHVPEAAAPYFRDVQDHLLRAADAVEAVERQLGDVLQANTARVTVGQSEVALRQNGDMRKISAWAAIALVPTAIAGVYGMNFDHMPELHWVYGYPAVLVVIVTACVVLHRVFRRNGWL
ncbi:magnesium and cobalt transport protein CorA [Cellulomonas telluris]|uniref:magnesium and cobalt transport protein CorA n=1 Tax=Cellulomonas telluris TaxID=2306636 RepID=UPI001FECEE4C|nr:magnesium and cobalt transport protein CorA [Cellulomonas telluris]